jgi:hypothetical protein
MSKNDFYKILSKHLKSERNFTATSGCLGFLGGEEEEKKTNPRELEDPGR